MSNEWEFAEMQADAEKWRSIKKILREWVGEVKLRAPGVLSDGVTPMCGKFETEALWRQANKLLGVFNEPRILKLSSNMRTVDIKKKGEHDPHEPDV